MKPHIYLTIHTPDTIAECFAVSKELYRFLWNELVPLMKPIDKEEGGPSDFVGVNCVADMWDSVPQHHREELNRVCEAEDAERERAREEYRREHYK